MLAAGNNSGKGSPLRLATNTSSTTTPPAHLIQIPSPPGSSGEFMDDPPPPYNKLDSADLPPLDYPRPKRTFGSMLAPPMAGRSSPFGQMQQGLHHIPQQFRPFVIGALIMTIILLSTMLMMPDMRSSRKNPPPIQWVSKMTTAVHVHWGKEHQDEELVKRYVTAVVTSPFAKPPRNYLSICAIVRNEEVRESAPKDGSYLRNN